ncbi:MAG: DMT family transporter, partial [Rhodoferax sp.]|uniref:DMT family transporter n=1 Tax=Rhodoferax sp. TaxID=50421 RepID=UPI0032676E3B
MPTPSSLSSSASAANLRGILAMVVAVGSFSVMDAALKTLSHHYPPLQVASMRGLVALPLVALYVLWRKELPSLWKVRWPLHLLRMVIGVTMLSLFVTALRTLGLAEAYTIFFIAPLLITVLSIPVLQERVRPRHWLALAGGLCGVVVALRPDQEAFLSLGALAVLGSAVCYAVSAVTGRVLSRTDSSAALVFWGTSGLALGAGVLAWPHWVAVLPGDAPVLAVIAVSGFAGQLAITQAFRYGQAAVVAPFEYTALAWGMALDGLLWHT